MSQTMLKEIKYQSPQKDISIQKCDLFPGFNPGNELDIFKSIPRRYKKQKPVNRGTYECSRLSRVYQLDMKDLIIRDIPRAGFVFYTFINNELYMSFGRDRVSGELTDYGGTRLKRINESSIRCAVREGNEESRFAFGRITLEQIQGFCCLYSINMLIVFIPVALPNNMDIREITKQNFNDARFLNSNQRKDPRYNEISEIVWLNESQLNNIFSEAPAIQMYAKVRRFMYSCNQFKNIELAKSTLKSVITDTPEVYSIDDLQKFYTIMTHESENVPSPECLIQTVRIVC
jgi:hypothetical protein